jgi:hypothetical protein
MVVQIFARHPAAAKSSVPPAGFGANQVIVPPLIWSFKQHQ